MAAELILFFKKVLIECIYIFLVLPCSVDGESTAKGSRAIGVYSRGVDKREGEAFRGYHGSTG